jgi:hypothetical protein
MAEQNDHTDSETQVGLALAALGVAFAKTLEEHRTPPDVIATLQRKCQVMYNQLRMNGDHKAAVMFGTFLQTLRDPKRFDQK